ncbi:MAG: glycosyltransferase [Bryobacterales bacterium]|nr:glycosyltransferase [Bryobacterales bacterium]
MTGKRILWITERYPPAKGGMAVSCARQVRGLRRRGMRVDVLVMDRAAGDVQVHPRDNGEDIFVGHTLTDAVGPNLAWNAVSARHSREPYTCTVGFGAAWPGYLATTFAAWLDIGGAVLVRGNDLDRDWFLPRRGGWVREALSRARAIGAVSPEKVRRISRLFPEKPVTWTPNGVDAVRWRLLPSDEQRRSEVRSILDGDRGRIIGLFGDLKAKKGVTFWLEAVRDAGLLSRMGLLIVGQLDPVTSRILDDPALAPRSMRIPFSPPDELAGLYAACDFVALPSSFDGMPNVLLEAMACGVIPIASSAGAMSELIADGENGFLFRPENRDAAGQATSRALALSDGEKTVFSNRARAVVQERFTLDRELDVLLDLLARATL